MTVTARQEPLPLRGNDLALDFINTVADVRTGLGEHLPDPRSLLAWALHAGAISEREARRIAASIARDSRRAEAAYRRTLRFRQSMTRLVTRSDAGDADLTALDEARRRAAGARELQRTRAGYSLIWRDPLGLDVVTLRLAEAGVALMTSDRLAQVRQCAGVRCGWLFLDATRGHRRWCSMQDCGNRAKVRRFRDRQRLDH